LLSYESLAARGPVEIVKLGDVAIRVVTGVTPQASNVRYYEGGANPWIRTQDVNFNRISVASEFVTDAAIDELPLKWVKANSVIVAISGASAGRSAILGIDAVTNQHCCNLEIDSKRADYRYVYYSIAARYNELRSLGRGARGDLNVSIIKSFEIPLPLVEQQSAVADLLDHFDALVNDISSGLPAEIAARRAQYEHYRDRLLSFSEKKAE
jgi:type I restriction-modification system specificity determinant